MSNRIAGPMHRLVNQFNAMKNSGSVKDIEFREKDYFKEVASSFNEFIKNKPTTTTNK